MYEEDHVWETIHPDNIWVMDKLILSRKLGYLCGPVGMDVPKEEWYIVRPCVNALGLGLGARFEYLKKDTDHLTPGHFWCQVFRGRHFSVDYNRGKQILCVEGFRDKSSNNDLTRWKEWIRSDVQFEFPEVLKEFSEVEWINCEYIDGRLIEVHFRRNPDFKMDIDRFIPVWAGEEINPPEGSIYIEDPEIHDRIGAYVFPALNA